MPYLSRTAFVARSAENLLRRLGKDLALLVSNARRRRRLMHTRAILDELSEAQLRDIGIDRWTAIARALMDRSP
jgi:uncharacterized protein YjiS (DUF1127 family)